MPLHSKRYTIIYIYIIYYIDIVYIQYIYRI